MNVSSLPLYRRLLRRGAALSGAVLLGLPAAAVADKEIQAGPVNRFTTPEVTMDQGEKVFFRNLDVNDHNVIASMAGADGKPVFASATIGQNETALVDGAQYLTTGNYEFICNLHPFMVGTLHVSTGGSPQPKPGTGGVGTTPDTTAPTVSVRIASARAASVRRSRGLSVTARVNEAATVSFKATTVYRGRTITFARGSLKFAAEGSLRKTLTLTSAGRKAMKSKRAITVKVVARATDAAGNIGKATRSKRLSA